MESNLKARIMKVEKPWGGFRQYTLNEETTVKIIEVNPGHSLSLQRHRRRDELWVILDEGLIVEIEGKKYPAKKGQEFFIRRGTKHRLVNSVDTEVCGRVLEISFGFFDENDIERIEDNYGRV
ncbi:MAG: phosphomannose isomerase type II C-terminal cupin domain [Candidatus Woesearchaeota archaeon]